MKKANVQFYDLNCIPSSQCKALCFKLLNMSYVPFTEKIMNDKGKFESTVDHKHVFIFKCGLSPSDISGKTTNSFVFGKQSSVTKQ